MKKIIFALVVLFSIIAFSCVSGVKTQTVNDSVVGADSTAVVGDTIQE